MNINIPPVVKNLLIINVIFYIATWLVGQNSIPGISGGLTEILGVYYVFSPKFKAWQIISYMFMHDPTSILHIAFNMFALYMFGGILESRWGAKKFINFYLITGLGALVLQFAVQALEVYQITGSINPDLNSISNLGLSLQKYQTLEGIYMGPMIGASGAIFGIMTAFAMLYPNVELFLMFIPIPVKAKYFIPIYIVIELFLGVRGFAGDSVAHFAHLGGALFGFILVKLWKDNNKFYDYYE